jgi:two-component system, NtrC family, sensor histidine kinase HydH
LKPQFNLQRWFAVVSLATITAISGTVASLLSWFMSERLLLQEAVLTNEFVQSLVRVEQSLYVFLVDPSAGLEPQTEQAFRHVAAMPNVMRANVFGLQRRIIWSSNLQLIGRRFGQNPELERALGGEVVVEFESWKDRKFDKEEHRGRASLKDSFVEIYVPVRDPDDPQRVIGVIEFYKAPHSLLAAISQLREYVVIGAVLSGAILFVALFGLVRRADRLIDAQQKRLVESETLAVIGEMSSAVAHGIRNPLASIRSSAEVIPLSDAAGIQDAVQDIVSESDRLEAWVRDLLSYTRPIEGAATAVSLQALVERGVADLARETQKRGISLEVDWAGDLPPVRGDTMLYAQVLRSLLTNAIEASEPGSRIEVRGRRDAQGSAVTLSVEDHGRGMSPAELDRAGKPFHTTKSRGMGVGLALARRVVERFGGRLVIDSERGQGTIVQLTLQLA